MKRTLFSCICFVLYLYGTVCHANFRPFVGGHTVEVLGKKRQVQVDLPTKLHIENTAGIDGLGLCVFASIQNSLNWHSSDITDFFEWMKKQPGGGYPSKVDSLLKKYTLERGKKLPPYVHYYGSDIRALQYLLERNALVCVTYSGRDGVYYRGPIAHMVNVVYADEDVVAILDNNFPSRYLWMSSKDFVFRWRENAYGGWSIIFLLPPVPPVPVNLDYPGDRESFEHSFKEAPAVPYDDSRLFEWKFHPATPKQLNLYDVTSGQQIGAMDLETRQYRHYDRWNKVWSEPTEPPVPYTGQAIISGCMIRGECPVRIDSKNKTFNFGVMQQVEPNKGVKNLDDIKKAYQYGVDSIHLTWIGDNVPNEFYSLLQELQKENIVGAAFSSNHWAVEGFPSGLIVQESYGSGQNSGWGRVIFRAEVVPSAEQVIGIIRRWREGYSPLKDVVIKKIVEQKIKEPLSYPVVIAVLQTLLLLIALFVIIRKR